MRDALQRAHAKRDQIEFEIDFYEREADWLEGQLAAAKIQAAPLENSDGQNQNR